MLQAQKQFHHTNLGSLLVQEKVITRQQLDEALVYQSKHHGKKLGTILADTGATTSGFALEVP